MKLKKRILIACEYSGTVRDSFLMKGFNAVSCDLLESESDMGNHLMQDVIPLLKEEWDLVVAFPPCTNLCVSGAKHFQRKRQDGTQKKSIDFFMLFTKLECKWCIENPVGIMSSFYRKPDQIIQPWQFGHGETKATCLWLNGLTKLKPTRLVMGRENRIHRMPPSDDRAKLRSATYTGVARAMANQWCHLL
jgi:hypothetical protein